ncbi:MAG: low affinity iron permease family protein, partial [Candidatus Dadabacteria bacterium]|nr:low affinity iron permease family protein [Candidatus Dadabacteria bacterium]
VKLDELIRAVEGAHNALLDLEELDEKELESIRQQYETLARKAREELTTRARNGIPDAPDGVKNHGN